MAWLNSPTTARLRIFPVGGVVDTWHSYFPASEWLTFLLRKKIYLRFIWVVPIGAFLTFYVVFASGVCSAYNEKTPLLCHQYFSCCSNWERVRKVFTPLVEICTCSHNTTFFLKVMASGGLYFYYLPTFNIPCSLDIDGFLSLWNKYWWRKRKEEV